MGIFYPILISALFGFRHPNTFIKNKVFEVEKELLKVFTPLRVLLHECNKVPEVFANFFDVDLRKNFEIFGEFSAFIQPIADHFGAKGMKGLNKNLVILIIFINIFLKIIFVCLAFPPTKMPNRPAKDQTTISTTSLNGYTRQNSYGKCCLFWSKYG